MRSTPRAPTRRKNSPTSKVTVVSTFRIAKWFTPSPPVARGSARSGILPGRGVRVGAPPAVRADDVLRDRDGPGEPHEREHQRAVEEHERIDPHGQEDHERD